MKKRITPEERALPNSPEAEKQVLGSIFVEGESALSKIRDVLMPGDFYSGKHRLIYQAIIDLSARGEPVDIVTVGHCLDEKDEIQQAGGALELSHTR